MKDVSYVLLDVFAILILISLRIGNPRRSGKFMAGQRIFELMITVNMVVLLLDGLTWYLNGNTALIAVILNRVITCCFFIINPVMSFLYVLFCDSKLKVSVKKRKKTFFFYCIPLLIHGMLALISAFYPLLFQLGPDNVYRRGPVFAFSFIVSYGYLIYAFINTYLAYRRKDRAVRDSKVYASLLLFPIPPIVGGIFQSFLPQVSVIWCSTVISLLIIFIQVQNSQITTDALTGLLNRGQILPYAEWKSSRLREKKLFAILIDLDDFKHINDSFGHAAGDRALITASEIIKSSCSASDFVGRYGGDEFVVIAVRNSEKAVETIIGRINSAFAKYNAQHAAPYSLSASMGYSSWSDGYANADAFISAADARMYMNKAQKTH